MDIFSNIRLCFMQAYVTIAQSCGDASSQFSHVLTEIIFVEIVFWQQVVGIVTAGRMLGLFVLKPSQYGTFLFCSIEIFFDLGI